MKYDVALINSYHGDPLSPEWYFEIKRLGKRCVIITPNPNEYESLLNQNVEVIYLNKFFSGASPGFQAIEKYFNSLGIENFKAYILNEQAYYGQSINTVARLSYQYLKAYEAIFKEYNFGCILHFTQGGEVARRIPTFLAHRNSIPVIYLGETFIPGTMTLYSDEYRTLINPNHGRILELHEIEEIIKSKLEKKAVISYDSDKRSHKPIALYKKVINYIRDKNWYIVRTYFVHKRMLHIDPYFKKIYLKMSRIYGNPNMAQDKYFYYPLNVGAESELFIRNSDFIDQVGNVQQLAAYLPVGFKMYVKTHPSKEGLLSIKDYHRLSKLKNVVLLRPEINSYELVKKSCGVLLVTGTIAQEAYLMKKPVLIMGNWPFKNFGKFADAERKEEVFEKLLNFDTEATEPSEFIQNLYRYSVQGSAYSNKQDFDKLVNEIILLLDRKAIKSPPIG